MKLKKRSYIRINPKVLDKKGIEMSFNMIFTIIVGAFIMFIAIYATMRFINIGEQKTYTESASTLITNLGLSESGALSIVRHEINFQRDTRIYLTCDEGGDFGVEGIAFSEKTLGSNYGDRGSEVSTMNNYIFSEDTTEGKKIYIFSMPFTFPFRIADLVFFTNKEYCFFKPTRDVENEISNELGSTNINIAKSQTELSNCSGIVVCFDSQSNPKCEIKVYPSEKKVVKNNQEAYYEGVLVYGAIFSSKDIYECNVKRLMKRLAELSDIFNSKAKLAEGKQCSPELAAMLSSYASYARNMSSSRYLSGLVSQSKEIDNLNKAAGRYSGCKIY